MGTTRYGEVILSNSTIYQYCRGCGNGLIESAAICPKCGTPAGRGHRSGERHSGKIKATAILLAVLLGFWSYLYTFREDAGKFAISLVGSVFSIVLFVYSTILSTEWVTLEVFYFSIFSNVLLLMTGFTSWLIAIIVAARRDLYFYENY
jgi:uncharacterized membrane protein YagU involved in acid resistance